VGLDDDLDLEEDSNYFSFDATYQEKENEWDEIRKEIVGDYF
jgi:hypothetical protein